MTAIRYKVVVKYIAVALACIVPGGFLLLGGWKLFEYLRKR